KPISQKSKIEVVFLSWTGARMSEPSKSPPTISSPSKSFWVYIDMTTICMVLAFLVAGYWAKTYFTNSRERELAVVESQRQYERERQAALDEQRRLEEIRARNERTRWLDDKKKQDEDREEKQRA